MQTRSKEENVEDRKVEIIPVLVIVGVLLVIGGFALVVFTAMASLSGALYDYIGFGMFAAGIVSIWAAWHKLS
ncbi:MAG: hypothetical protein ACYCQJ_04370 [Nitrososphaerales archaeon]